MAIFILQVILLKNRSFYSKNKTLPYIIKNKNSILILIQKDFNLAKNILKMKKISIIGLVLWLPTFLVLSNIKKKKIFIWSWGYRKRWCKEKN